MDPRATLVVIRAAKSATWEDKTSEIADIAHLGSHVKVRFVRPAKQYRYGADRIRTFADPVLVPIPPEARLRVRGILWGPRDPLDLELREFGCPPDAWRTVTYRNGQTYKHRSYPADDVQVVPDAAGEGAAKEVMDYWRRHVESREGEDPLVVAYGSLRHIDPESVLATYLNGEAPARRSAPDALVFPFSCNLSQRDAVRCGLSHALSVIEGPPGTGKTQTILNLVANIVTADLGSVGVVSLGNSAVDNVADKLTAEGFGHIFARLGNREMMQAFRDGRETREALVEQFLATAPAEPVTPAELTAAARRLTRALDAERRGAQLRARIDAYALEQRHFERHLGAGTVPELGDLPLFRRSPRRILELVAETQLDRETRPPGLLRRIRRYLRYGSLRDLDTADSEVVLALQRTFYARRIAELERQLAAVERELDAADIKALAEANRELSVKALAAAVASRHRDAPRAVRSGDVPRDAARFAAFCRTHPVILSTCHSLRRQLPDGYLLDYLIIDEASQVDLLTASLAMASCRNLIVVGDRRQLPHIPGKPVDGVTAPAPAYDCQQHSVLTSVGELYGDDVPVTLLREHYRCHPAIIGFCNTAFYGDELIPYTETEGRSEPAMWVHATVAGNHMRRLSGRGRFNQRELEVIEQEVIDQAPVKVDAADVAVAAPFRLQADKAAEALKEVAGSADTVHKLQGRERRMVIMTTVLSENAEGRRGLRFVDDPRLVNVAVSRATDHFVLVTNHEKLANSRHLRDLIGYIEHRYPDHQPDASRIVSVFDLLYAEYDDVLRTLAARLPGRDGSPAEQIVDAVLDDVLAEPAHAHLRVERQVLLRNLVPDPDALGDAQRAFVRRRSSIDFVIANRITRRPLLAIEVDGFEFHENRPEQRRRDALKDGVLEHVGIPLLRLATTDSDEERRIREALTSAERVPL
ncbi:AAA domain-containing protein [Conexibacter sp. JD483]|uniref:AAA domain-containing protein n=1 Tax=unclassified Conexibacter TaxID=2627773 RepID=UPI00271C7838|nr:MULTISPECIES: AAA domain-containing protein [unclassified Conexibacter]MDO8184765.1 AAA domain-containing protein [Conexibacter sp. CPCC 205706]MDO8196540.1 AAA domain-containing protein [Conexibacter sp. CPCC 205762]MDR9369026.1 AAA domain-containing protein [Conexibacter sp. JD483]